MRYILLNNGTGVFRRDATRVKTKKIDFKFEGAPERCEVHFKHEGMTLAMPLINGEVTLDVSHIRGSLQTTVRSDEKSWKCDSLFIGEYKTGELFVATESCYGEKIAALTRRQELLEKKLEILEKTLFEAKKEFKITKTYHDII